MADILMLAKVERYCYLPHSSVCDVLW